VLLNDTISVGMTEVAPTIDFKDNVYLITGVASGIGMALTKSIIRFGGTVIGVDAQKNVLEMLTDLLGAERFASLPYNLFHPLNSQATAIKFKNALIETCKDFGKDRLDGYVANAGIQKIHFYDTAYNVLNTPADELRDMCQVNAISHYEIAQVVYPYLAAADKGRVLSTTSSVVGRNELNLMSYIMSKELQMSMTEKISKQAQIDGENIYVNAWNPPPTQLTLVRNEYQPNEPLFANAQPVDVLGLPLSLLSKCCAFSGATLSYVDQRVDAHRIDESIPEGLFKANERTEHGFRYDITVRPLNEGKGTEGNVIIKNYDSWETRRALGEDPVPPIDMKKRLKDVTRVPAFMTERRHWGNCLPA